jgi:hypothetical protein
LELPTETAEDFGTTISNILLLQKNRPGIASSAHMRFATPIGNHDLGATFTTLYPTYVDMEVNQELDLGPYSFHNLPTVSRRASHDLHSIDMPMHGALTPTPTENVAKSGSSLKMDYAFERDMQKYESRLLLNELKGSSICVDSLADNLLFVRNRYSSVAFH